MKRLTIFLLGLVLAGTAYADDANSGGLFESLRKKIELLTPKKKLKTTTAVGGVRGSLADAGELYWKGKTTEQVIDADELAAFEEALNQAEMGDMALAEKGLNDFLASYPQSQLRSDAEGALALVKEQPMAPEEVSQ